MYELMTGEMRSVAIAPLEDNESHLKERLRKYSEYLNRLAFIRNECETFNQIAYTKELVQFEAEGKKTTTAKECALSEASGPNYMASLARYLSESLKEGKSSIQSLLSAEKAARWAGNP